MADECLTWCSARVRSSRAATMSPLRINCPPVHHNLQHQNLQPHNLPARQLSLLFASTAPPGFIIVSVVHQPHNLQAPHHDPQNLQLQNPPGRVHCFVRGVDRYGSGVQGAWQRRNSSLITSSLITSSTSSLSESYLPLSWSRLCKMRIPKVDCPGLWYKSVDLCCGNDQSTRLRQS